MSLLDATLCFVDNLDDEPEEGRGAGSAAGGGGDGAAGGGMSAGEKIGMWNSSLVGGYQSYVEYAGTEAFVIYSGAKPAHAT